MSDNSNFTLNSSAIFGYSDMTSRFIRTGEVEPNSQVAAEKPGEKHFSALNYLSKGNSDDDEIAEKYFLEQENFLKGTNNDDEIAEKIFPEAESDSLKLVDSDGMSESPRYGSDLRLDEIASDTLTMEDEGSIPIRGQSVPPSEIPRSRRSSTNFKNSVRFSDDFKGTRERLKKKDMDAMSPKKKKERRMDQSKKHSKNHVARKNQKLEELEKKKKHELLNKNPEQFVSSVTDFARKFGQKQGDDLQNLMKNVKKWDETMQKITEKRKSLPTNLAKNNNSSEKCRAKKRQRIAHLELDVFLLEKGIDPKKFLDKFFGYENQREDVNAPRRGRPRLTKENRSPDFMEIETNPEGYKSKNSNLNEAVIYNGFYKVTVVSHSHPILHVDPASFYCTAQTPPSSYEIPDSFTSGGLASPRTGTPPSYSPGADKLLHFDTRDLYEGSNRRSLGGANLLQPRIFVPSFQSVSETTAQLRDTGNHNAYSGNLSSPRAGRTPACHSGIDDSSSFQDPDPGYHSGYSDGWSSPRAGMDGFSTSSLYGLYPEDRRSARQMPHADHCRFPQAGMDVFGTSSLHDPGDRNAISGSSVSPRACRAPVLHKSVDAYTSSLYGRPPGDRRAAGRSVSTRRVSSSASLVSSVVSFPPGSIGTLDTHTHAGLSKPAASRSRGWPYDSIGRRAAGRSVSTRRVSSSASSVSSVASFPSGSMGSTRQASDSGYLCSSAPLSFSLGSLAPLSSRA